MGVIAIIYEARPNVTVDAAVLSLKTSNAVILRGGSEAILSNIAIMNAPPSAAPASDGLYIDAINLKLYIAAGGMWFTMNLDEYQI